MGKTARPLLTVQTFLHCLSLLGRFAEFGGRSWTLAPLVGLGDVDHLTSNFKDL